MASFLFVLSRGPEDPTRAVRCTHLAKIAAEKGHDVTLFLVDDAVMYAHASLVDRVKAPTGDDLATYLAGFLEHGGKVLCCTPCCVAREVEEEELPPGFALGTAYQLVELAEHAKVFSF